MTPYDEKIEELRRMSATSNYAREVLRLHVDMSTGYLRAVEDYAPLTAQLAAATKALREADTWLTGLDMFTRGYAPDIDTVSKSVVELQAYLRKNLAAIESVPQKGDV